MTSTRQVVLTAAIVGGICGALGAAFYVVWRAQRKTTDERASRVVRQLERVADRMQNALHSGVDDRGLALDPPPPADRPGRIFSATDPA